MFSHNGRISGRQLSRMLVLSVFAGGIFVIPYLSAKQFGTSVIPGFGIFFVLAGVYVAAIHKLAHSMHFVELAVENGFSGRVVLVVQVLRQIIRLVFFVVLSVAILEEAQVPFMHSGKSGWNLLVVLPLLLVAFYGAAGTRREAERQPYRIEKQGRLYEMIFWVLFVPFIAMVILGLGELDWRIFVPHWDKPFATLVMCACFLLVFLVPVENYFYLRPCLAGKKGGRTYCAVMGAVAVIILLSLALMGIYGVRGAGSEEMLTIAIMRYIKLPFGILGRFDSLVVWFFMTGCFVLISQTLYFTGYLLSALFPKAQRIWLLLAVAVLALVVPVFLPEYRTALPAYMRYGVLVDLPLSLIMPLLLWGLGRFRSSGKQRRTE